VRTVAAVGSIVFGIVGVGTVLVFPTVALIAGLFAIALGALGRRRTASPETAARVGLILGTVAVVGVLFIVVFLSDF
jgi:hypothetical protein